MSDHDEWYERHLQLSAAEVPGFAVRTAIDDVIGKLYAIRSRLVVDVPVWAPGLMDDVESIVDDLVGELYDESVDEVEDDVVIDVVSVSGAYRADRRHLAVSGSSRLSHCSCGGVYLS